MNITEAESVRESTKNIVVGDTCLRRWKDCQFGGYGAMLRINDIYCLNVFHEFTGYPIEEIKVSLQRARSNQLRASLRPYYNLCAVTICIKRSAGFGIAGRALIVLGVASNVIKEVEQRYQWMRTKTDIKCLYLYIILWKGVKCLWQ